MDDNFLESRILDKLEMGQWITSDYLAKALRSPIEKVNGVLFRLEKEKIVRKYGATSSILNFDYSWMLIKIT